VNKFFVLFVFGFIFVSSFVFGFGINSYLNESRFNELNENYNYLAEEHFTAYKTTRLSNIYSKIIFDSSYYGEVQEDTAEMIKNYKIEFGADIPKIKVSVVGGN